MSKKVAVVFGTVLAIMLTAGTVNADKKKSTLWGAGIGAVAGSRLGGNFSDVAVGALAGGGLGYLAGDAKDKKRAEEQAARESEARAKARITSDPATAYRSPDTNRFAGSTWRIVSLVSDDPELYPDYADMVVTFATSSNVSTMAVHKDGTTETCMESYAIVDDVTVISGEDSKTGEAYVVNAKFSVDENQLIVVAPEARFVFNAVR